MATMVEIEPVIMVREMASGAVYAHPVADPSLACRATSAEAALAEQERFLTDYLELAPAWRLADFGRPGDARLLEVAAVLPRADLPRRLRVREPVTTPCLLVPHRGAIWVHILALQTFVFLEHEEGLERAVAEEIGKAASVRALGPAEYLRLLPAQKHRLERLRLRVPRKDLDDRGERAEQRRRKAKGRERAGADKMLASVGADLVATRRVGVSAPILGRTREIDTLQSLLGGPERLGVLLVGPELAGKSAVVHGLVDRMLERRSAGPLAGRKLIATSGAQLVAGQSGFGQLQERVEEVMRAAEELDAIVYFDNLADMLCGRPGTIEDLVSGMLPYVTDDRVRVVGELTPEQASHYEKMHVGFLAALNRITVEPLDKATTRSVLEARVRANQLQAPHRPNLTPEALDPLMDLSERYLAYEAFPGKAVRLCEELRAVHEFEVTDDGQPRPIGPPEVYRAFSTRSGIPLFLLRDDRSVKHEEIEAFFATRVIGQQEAVRRIAQTLCMVKANLQPPAKPLSNFLFIGPTGVGKTEVAKTLARFLFGSPDRLVRFDMSEYMDPLAAERLIRGTTRDEGELTKRVRQQPFCVVLLDEIEKAHPAVFDLLLQVCGEGRLSDARGRTTWFHNAIIIMTSNLGAAHRRPDAGFGGTQEDRAAATDRYYLEQVDQHFRPEFVNRIDRVIPFAGLGRGEIVDVARVALRRICERDGLVGRDATLTVSEAALQTLAADGFSAEYGARALRRHLEDALVAPVASVAAEQAASFDGARVTVLVHDEAVERGGDEVTTLADRVCDRLRILVERPAQQGAGAAVANTGAIAHLRRQADRCLHAPLLEELRERIDYLVADLASAPPTNGGEMSERSKSAAELGKLRGLLRSAQDQRDVIAAAEDLAVVAQLEGVSSTLFADEAVEGFGRFEVEFVRTVVGFLDRDEFVFSARGTSHPIWLREFLVPFLRGAQARGWEVLVHRLNDREPDAGWPTECRWGAPRTLGWCLDVLPEHSDARMAKLWRGVLVRVRGPGVGGLLHQEMGVWCLERDGAERYVELDPMGNRFALDAAELSKDDWSPPKVRKRDEVSRLPAARRWSEQGVVTLSHPPVEFATQGAAGYWRDLERIQFPGLAERVVQGRSALGEEA